MKTCLLQRRQLNSRLPAVSYIYLKREISNRNRLQYMCSFRRKLLLGSRVYQIAHHFSSHLLLGTFLLSSNLLQAFAYCLTRTIRECYCVVEILGRKVQVYVMVRQTRTDTPANYSMLQVPVSKKVNKVEVSKSSTQISFAVFFFLAIK